MLTGTHMIIYSNDAESDRAFIRDILGFKSVDAGRGWLIFALPKSEVAFHPAGDAESGKHEIFLMCDDIDAETKMLKEKGVKCSDLQDEPWGKLINITLPGGSELGLYEPKHPTALEL